MPECLDLRDLKGSIVSSIGYANSESQVSFGDVARATLLLDEGSEVVGIVSEIQFWFNDMDCSHIVVVCIDDGDETFYCNPDGMELVREGDADD